MKYSIDVEITKLEVDSKYYSFSYSITVNGRHHKNGTYSSDHVWADNIDAFKDVLTNGYALDLALENFSYNLTPAQQQ